MELCVGCRGYVYLSNKRNLISNTSRFMRNVIFKILGRFWIVREAIKTNGMNGFGLGRVHEMSSKKFEGLENSGFSYVSRSMVTVLDFAKLCTTDVEKLNFSRQLHITTT